jgi:hypothetical protein
MRGKSKQRGQAHKSRGRAARPSSWLWRNKLNAAAFALLTAAFASALLAKPIPTAVMLEAFEDGLGERMHVVRATVLTALLTLVPAAALSLVVGLYIKGVVKKLLAGRLAGGREHAVSLALFIAGAAVILCFALPQTRLWRLALLWWDGPEVDLVSASPLKTFRPAINLPWVNYGQDFGVVAGWTRRGVSQDRAALDASFGRLHESGVNCVLWFLLADGRGAPSFDEQGYVKGLDESFLEDYDAAIEVGRRHRIAIVWVLLDFHWFVGARQEAGAALSGHADVVEDEGRMESFLQRALLPLVRRHPYEPQIAGWLLINEPENALKKAHVSAERLAEFTRRAGALIRRYSYRQPVSVGSADLESLVEYWAEDDSDLDFLVFHHYEKFLPPPADYVRGLMKGARDKPIYVGEFNLSAPPLSFDELARWIGRLGYAGLWGWSLNDGTAARPRYEEAKQFSDAVVAAGPGAENLRELFREQRAQPTRLQGGHSGPDLSWWVRHGSETVTPGVSANISQWEKDSNAVGQRLAASKDERKAKEKELEGPVADCSRLNRAYLDGSKSKVEMFDTQLKDYSRQLEQAETNRDDAWKRRVLGWQREAERNMKKEQDNVRLYAGALRSCGEWEGRVKGRIQELDTEIKSGGALANWYRYKILWSGRLYQEFWRAELAR